jgi:hypothetical protein
MSWNDCEIISCPMAFHEVCSRWLQLKGKKLHVHMQIKGNNSLFIFSFYYNFISPNIQGLGFI